MILETNGTTITTGFTGAGQLYVKKTGPKGSIIKTTTNPIQFLRNLLAADMENQLDSKYRCSCCAQTFTSGYGARIGGQDPCGPTFDVCLLCIESGNHFDRLRAMELDDAAIHHLTEYCMRYL